MDIALTIALGAISSLAGALIGWALRGAWRNKRRLRRLRAIDAIGNSPLLPAQSTEPRLNRLGHRKALFMNCVALCVFEADLVRIARIFHQSKDCARLI